MSLTGFFDQTTQSIDGQLEVAKDLDIKLLSFRYFDNQPLLSVDPNTLKQLPIRLKKDKLSLQVVDAMYRYHLSTINKNDLTLLFQNAETLGTKYLILTLPSLDSFDVQHDQLVEHIKYLMDETKKKHFELVFGVPRGYAVGQIAYLINEIKSIRFVFDAGVIHQIGSSVTTSYRILKNNTQLIRIYDIEKDGQPYLLGFGVSNIIEVLKKANRDKFKGLYMMDNNLASYIENRQTVYQQKKFLGLFSKNKKEKVQYQKMDQKLHIQNEQDLSMLDMHKIYVSVIKKVIE